jgi:hypothetical protein
MRGVGKLPCPAQRTPLILTLLLDEVGNKELVSLDRGREVAARRRAFHDPNGRERE